MFRFVATHVRLVQATRSAIRPQQQLQQQRSMMYNPNQRKPSNKKKKRKLRRKTRKEERLRPYLENLRLLDGRVAELVYYNLPYPVKLQKIVEKVNQWYDDIMIDFTLREALLSNEGWLPVSFVHGRLGKWTNHGIIINALLQTPDRFDLKGVDMFPPLPDSFAEEAERWKNYKFDEEDFHEEEWFDLYGTDLVQTRKLLEVEDDSKDFDAMFRRVDFNYKRVKVLDDAIMRKTDDTLQEFPTVFGDEDKRNPPFGYHDMNMNASVSSSSLPDLRNMILSKRKKSGIS